MANPTIDNSATIARQGTSTSYNFDIVIAGSDLGLQVNVFTFLNGGSPPLPTVTAGGTAMTQKNTSVSTGDDAELRVTCFYITPGTGTVNVVVSHPSAPGDSKADALSLNGTSGGGADGVGTGDSTGPTATITTTQTDSLILCGEFDDYHTLTGHAPTSPNTLVGTLEHDWGTRISSSTSYAATSVTSYSPAWTTLNAQPWAVVAVEWKEQTVGGANAMPMAINQYKIAGGL
jgi:hypothetical protein